MPRQDDPLKKDPTRRELYPKPDADPDEQEIISPSMIKIGWPSFDLQSKEFGAQATKAYLQYMLGGGPRSFTSKLSTKTKGYLAVDYGAKVANKTVWECWDYHGPLSIQVDTTFTDQSLQEAPEGLQQALQACFVAGGFEGTDEEMHAFEEILGALKYSMTHRLLGFDAEPIQIPLGEGKTASMNREAYVKAVMEAGPEVHIHWRGA